MSESDRPAPLEPLQEAVLPRAPEKARMTNQRQRYLRRTMQRAKPLSLALRYDRYLRLLGIGMPDDRARRMARLSPDAPGLVPVTTWNDNANRWSDA